MAKISFRCEEWLAEGVEHIANQADLSVSEVLRQAAVELVNDWQSELPEWVQKEASHSDMVKKNKPELRSMHFKQRVFDYARDALTNDMDKLARYPPHPDKMEQHYFEMLREEIQNEAPGEWEEEYRDHVEEVMEWYRLMHPDVDHGSVLDEVKALAAWHYRRGRKKEARTLVRRADDDGQLPAGTSVHDVIDEAREEAVKEGWKHDWDEAIKST